MKQKVALGVVVVLVVMGLVWWSLLVPDMSPTQLRLSYATASSQFMTWKDGTKVHFRDQGPRSAPVVVLLHGSNASLHTWEGWVRKLVPRYRVLTVDLPGHGLTGKVPDGDYTLPAMARFVESFLKARGVSQCVLGGNSMGGALAWQYTVAHPKQVKRLILVDAAGVPRSEKGRMPLAFQLAKIPVLRNLLVYVMPRSLVAEGLKRSYGDPSKVTAEAIDRYYHLALHPGNRLATVKRFASYGLITKVPSALKTIKVPTLVLWGGKDVVTPTLMSKAYASSIPNNKLIIYPDLGHIPMEEAPARTVKDVLAFLAR